MIKLSEGQLEQRGDIALILPYTLLYLLGALSFLYPEHAAFWGSRWKFQNEPELSAAGLFSMQLGSVLIMVLAVVMLFIPFSL